jgi:uncharacterized protein (DUF2141 family)
MKRTLFLLAALLMASAVLAAGGKGSLTVVMTGFKNGAGMAMASVFSGPDGFPYETAKAVQKARIAIKDGKAVAVFPDMDYGTYAVAVFHDEDSSGKLEKNVFGIPKKGYGLSNEPPGFPNFDKSKFSLDAPSKTINITLKY